MRNSIISTRRVLLTGITSLLMSSCAHIMQDTRENTMKTIDIPTPDTISVPNLNQITNLYNPTLDHIKELLAHTEIDYNGSKHHFPKDALVFGPDIHGVYTITSEKLTKVTQDMLQFDKGLNLITKEIKITIDIFDLITTAMMQIRFGLKDGDICAVKYDGKILSIRKR